ncbi:MAG: NADH-quinone oxidoreductase subunit L, partial [Cytophagales bacterium]
PEVLGGSSMLAGYFAPIFEDSMLLLGESHHLSHSIEYILMGVSVAAAVLAIIVAYVLYVAKNSVPMAEGQEAGVVKVIYNKYYIDEIYDFIFRKPVDALSSFFYSVVELLGIDKIVNGFGGATIGTSKVVRLLQSGNIGFYVFAMVLGIALIFGFGLFI